MEFGFYSSSSDDEIYIKPKESSKADTKPIFLTERNTPKIWEPDFHPFGWNLPMKLIADQSSEIFNYEFSATDKIHKNLYEMNLLEHAVSMVVDEDYTLKVIDYLIKNDIHIGQSLMYAIQNGYQSLADRIFYSIPENIPLADFHSIIFDEYDTFILDYETHATHSICSEIKFHLSSLEDPKIEDALQTFKVQQSEKYGLAYLDADFVPQCCRQQRVDSIENRLCRKFHCLEGIKTDEERLEILSIKCKDDLKAKFDKIGDYLRLYRAVKNFHRKESWRPQGLQQAPER